MVQRAFETCEFLHNCRRLWFDRSTRVTIGVACYRALRPAGAEVTDMTTGKKPASNAGNELGSSKSTKAEKTVAGSAIAQAPHGGTGKGTKKR
jgi:hypothetical protein